jgi:heme exporter protein A
VAPDHRLYDELTAEENLLFFARLRGISLSRKLVRNHLEEVGLAAASKGPIRHFSSGMRQRLSFACALVHRPQFLFLDEPGAFLDKAGRDLLRQVIRNVCGSGGITILATNDPEEAGYGDMELRLGI